MLGALSTQTTRQFSLSGMFRRDSSSSGKALIGAEVWVPDEEEVFVEATITFFKFYDEKTLLMMVLLRKMGSL